MKIDPSKYLTEDERYLQHFWKPTKKHKVVYEDETYTIKKVMKAQASLVESSKLVWLQDLGWKPSLEDCDTIIYRFNAKLVNNNQILFKTNEQKSCFFERPNTLTEYVTVIRQIRVLNKFQETK